MEQCRLADADELLALFSTCPNDTMNGPGDSMTALRAELKARLVSLSKLLTLTLHITSLELASLVF